MPRNETSPLTSRTHYWSGLSSGGRGAAPGPCGGRVRGREDQTAAADAHPRTWALPVGRKQQRGRSCSRRQDADRRTGRRGIAFQSVASVAARSPNMEATCDVRRAMSAQSAGSA